jgi:hypothetical protein
VVLFLAVPTYAMEARNVQTIAAELQRLAQLLLRFPTVEGGGRSADPSSRIAASLRNVNATLENGLKQGALTPAMFDSIGRDFENIGKTLRSLGGASKPSTRAIRKTTRKTTRKPTRKTTRRKPGR